MRSPEFDALMVAVKGILDAELKQRRAFLKLTEISDDGDLATAVRSQRESFAAETDEIQRCAELLLAGCGSKYGGLVDEEAVIDVNASLGEEETPADVDESDDPDWDLFLRR